MSAKLPPIKSRHLLGIDIFSSLSLEARKLIASRMRRLRFKDGEVLLREGEEGSELYAILKGSVSITVRSTDGAVIPLTEVGPGIFFGEMALLERTQRSATVTAKGPVECTVLSADDFDVVLEECPLAATAILERMVRMSAGRLVNTGTFLAHMVTWGEDARKRAITDVATGLYNRRYLDDCIEASLAEAHTGKQGLCCAMLDLDHFGELNKTLGAAFCDKIIIQAASIFHDCFKENDILVRYGGDEFCFLIKADPRTAKARCDKVCSRIRELRWSEKPDLAISSSIGISILGPLAGDAKSLLEQADKALYRAKETGRDRVCFNIEEYGIKSDIDTIARKNRIGGRFARALQEKDSFLVIGHKEPDEDCISSMVAFALLAAKFNKRAMISLGPEINKSFEYLLQICLYNGIEIFRGEDLPSCSVLVLVDTPKPSMIDRPELYEAYRADSSVLKLEIDHHLEADSRYFTDIDHSLVYQASSSCEIIAWLTLKMQKNEQFMQENHIDDLLSRNLVLAILSGILGDTQMGRYIKTRRERQYYERFTSRFERILTEKTHKDSGNLATKEQIFTTLASLSNDEESCWRFFMKFRRKERGIHSIVLSPSESQSILDRYGNEVVVSVSKSISNRLAEDSGRLGLVAYFESRGKDPAKTAEGQDSRSAQEATDPLIQFRLRRSQSYTGIDLRDFLEKMHIENGGGHPGAVGFRISQKEVNDIRDIEQEILNTLEEMLSKIERGE